MAVTGLEYEGRLAKMEERCKSNSHRIDDLEKRQDSLDDLIGSVKVLAVREENVENVVQEIKTDVKSLTEKPAKRWDTVVEQILVTIIALGLGYVFARFGM